MIKVTVISAQNELDYWKQQFSSSSIGHIDIEVKDAFNPNLKSDLFILDYSGQEKAKDAFLELSPQLVGKQVVIVTDHKDADLAIEAIKTGAVGFLVKPFAEAEFKPILTKLEEINMLKEKEKKQAKIITFLSYKGGTGVSTATVNLAYALSAGYGKKTLLIDAAGFSNHLTVLLNTPPKCTIADICRKGEGLDANYLDHAVKMVTDNLGIIGGLLKTEDLGDINISAINNLLSVASESYDYIVIDTSTGSVDELTMNLVQHSSELLVLTTFDLLTVKDNRFYIEALKEMGIDESIIKPVINRQDWFIGSLEPELVQKQLSHQIYHALPNDWNLCVEAANYGRPVLDFAPESPLAISYKNLAGSLIGAEVEEQQSVIQQANQNPENKDAQKKGLFDWFKANE